MDAVMDKKNLLFNGAATALWLESAAVVCLLAAANMSLLSGAVSEGLLFYPSLVAAGEWWRVFTYPFVHVSWYHLILDGGAFILIYTSLEEESSLKRLLVIAAATACSLGASIVFSDIVAERGLSGLSGAAHGLMAVAALELITRYPRGDALRTAGFVFLALVTVKSLFEALTGNVFFSWLHFGDVGIPVAVAHLGGVVGGVLGYAILNREKLKGWLLLREMK